MIAENLDSNLHVAQKSRIVIITLTATVEPRRLTKLPGIAILIGPGVRPILKKMLETKAGVDVAQILGLSTKRITGLKRALGIPLDSRDGTSRTTAWREQKAAEAARRK